MEPVAIYIDFENIAISTEDAYGRCDIDKIIGVANSYGRCVIKRAYGDWTRFTRYRQELLEQAIDLTQLFRYGNYTKKNSADIVMAVDVIEAALTNPTLKTFVLVTGDSDFTAVARKLRGYGRYVVGIGLRDATSDLLVRSCDEFVIYDSLMERDENTSGFQVDEVRRLVLAILQRLTPGFENGRIPLAALTEEMATLRPDMTVTPLGFRDIPHFLASQREIALFTDSNGEVQVAFRSSHASRQEIDQTLQYRTALSTAGYQLVEREIRQDVLQALFGLLSSEPATHTLDEAIRRLKEQYDADNRLRSRDDIQEVARLLKQADVLENQPDSWELDPLSLRPTLAAGEFIQRCEGVYVAALMQRNLAIDDEMVARLLYGRADALAEVQALRELVGTKQSNSQIPLHLGNGHQLPRHLAENLDARVALQDMVNWRLEEKPTLEEAARLNAQGLEIRTADFEQARVYFLKAAKMMYQLLLEKAPGANLMDMEWYLASYCASTAGAHFSRHNYPRAILYYQAFFAIVKETEPVWDRVRKLVPPMLSFYFTIAPNEFSDLLKVAPGRTHPARLCVLLHNHRNEGVRRRWLELVREIVRINPTLLRGIIQRLAFLEDEDQLIGSQETRAFLARLLSGEPVGDDLLLAGASDGSGIEEDEEPSTEIEFA
ncbi:MAG: NYN domain-containing protein [Caldilineaceae bacterium]|nr:NYN domain-containing protein [Caldilineaceae bacterium]HRJ43609.1 NYN domain-containing protein [Caldilineaceae bacterium]